MGRFYRQRLKTLPKQEWYEFEDNSAELLDKYCLKCRYLKVICVCKVPNEGRSAKRKRKKAVEWKSPAAIRLFILELYGKKCLNCSSTSKLNLDHIVPRFWHSPRDLADHLDNFQVLCWECNKKKNHKIAIDYRLWRNNTTVISGNFSIVRPRELAFFQDLTQTILNLKIQKI